MKIYFSASIRGGRGDVAIYARLIEHLKRYGKVLTEHVGDKRISASGENLDSTIIHDRDIAWMDESDVAVLELTNPSLGVGYEVKHGVDKDKSGKKYPMLGLFRETEGKSLSAMIEGCGHIQIFRYRTIEEALEGIDNFFRVL